MKEELLSFLCAPDTCNPLELIIEEKRGQEIITGKLVDRVTKRIFPIIKGIPRFVSNANELRYNYTSSFGHQWITYNWLREEDRPEFESIIDRPIEDLGGKAILDAGCGGGRIARFVAPLSKIYVGIDYSVACERAYQLCQDYPQAHFIQADLNRLPFWPGPIFDFIFSHGVLHHTPDTKKSFQNLPPLLKTGGELYIAVFRKAFFLLRLSDAFFRFLICRMPLRAQEYICERMVCLQRLPRCSFWKRFFWFSMQKNSEIATFCNYDWYAPRYHWEHTAAEVMSWFAEYGFREIRYINAWPCCPPREKYMIPAFKNSFRLGQLLGVIGRKK